MLLRPGRVEGSCTAGCMLQPLSMLLVPGTAGASALSTTVLLPCTVWARAVGLGEDAPCHLYPYIQNFIIRVLVAALHPRCVRVPCVVGPCNQRAQLTFLSPCRAQRAGGSEYQDQGAVSSITGGWWGTRESLCAWQGRVLVAEHMGLGIPKGCLPSAGRGAHSCAGEAPRAGWCSCHKGDCPRYLCAPHFPLPLGSAGHGCLPPLRVSQASSSPGHPICSACYGHRSTLELELQIPAPIPCQAAGTSWHIGKVSLVRLSCRVDPAVPVPQRHGLKVLPQDPYSFTPLLEDRNPSCSLLMGHDMAQTQWQIAQFSQKDAEAYPEYEAFMGGLVSSLDPLLDTPPVDTAALGKGSLLQRLRALQALQPPLQAGLALGRQLPHCYEVLTAPISKILDQWFESEPLKAILATDAVIGAMASPHSPGSGVQGVRHWQGHPNTTRPGEDLWAAWWGGYRVDSASSISPVPVLVCT
ncbi:pyridine nucleotide-disulfide oxidoreductase domain-containing protein 2 isoform X3 [Heliangelus exortis]|uniref:pyridine nucleotide-disulfide oxidoreductase domain-containing protein 2 isoform X3 n=1 Tax=Heliangelus exortis TaxID=472823 RepID=UPI003A90D47B